MLLASLTEAFEASLPPTKDVLTADPLVPDGQSLREVARAAAGCRACPLWRDTTQTVFGEGPRRASLMLVGEQPGNDEDVQGHPFVGPAGRVLNSALELAGIDRKAVWLTNAVKHFKHVPRGKRRIHSRPNRSESVACRPWLIKELELVRPRGLVLMGAVAAQSLLGSTFRLTQHRGELLAAAFAPVVMATIHPAAVLRAATPADRKAMMAGLVDDLRAVARALRVTTAADQPHRH